MTEANYPMLPAGFDVRQYRRLLRVHQDFMRAVFDALQLGRIADQSFIVWEFLGRVHSPTAEQIPVMNFILQHYHFHWRFRPDGQPERSKTIYARLRKQERLWGANEAETWRILNSWNAPDDDSLEDDTAIIIGTVSEGSQ